MTTRKPSSDAENIANAQEETKILEHHVLQTPGKQTSNMGVPGPIYFLIREQAKSLVAIKELKERVKSVEGVQDDMFQAVNDLQFQMDQTLQMGSCFPDMLKGELFPCPKSDNVPQCIPPAKATTNQSLRASSTKMPSTGTTRNDDAKKGSEHGESDSKQDSGLDSDCQAHGDASLPLTRPGSQTRKDDGDELLRLLEVIAQKGSTLWQRVEECERLRDEDAALETRETFSNQDVGGLLQTCRSLQRRLREANAEKGNLRSQLLYIERVTEEMQMVNRQLEERLETVVRDKQRLETQIHRLHGQFVVRTGIDGKQEQRQKRIGRLRSNEESRNRVTAILKETNVLELQRQLLMYIMENEVLVVKLEQLEELRLAGSAEAEKNESRMQSEVQQLLKEKNELQAALAESRMDLTAVQAKVRMLERALQAVSQDPDNCASFDASGNSVRSQPASSGNLQQHRHHLNTGSNFHSLPPVLMPDGAHYLQEIQPFQDMSSYLNITSTDGIISGSHNGLMSPSNGEQLAYRRSSTPIRSRIDIPGFTPVGKLLVPQESYRSRSHQGTKSSQSQALLNSIRSEFDPLAPTRRDNHLGKGNEFVDSLDVNPTKIFSPNAFRDSPNMVTVPMSQMGNISLMRTPLIRQPQRTLRYNSDPAKRRSDGHNLLNQVDEALL